MREEHASRISWQQASSCQLRGWEAGKYHSLRVCKKCTSSRVSTVSGVQFKNLARILPLLSRNSHSFSFSSRMSFRIALSRTKLGFRLSLLFFGAKGGEEVEQGPLLLLFGVEGGDETGLLDILSRCVWKLRAFIGYVERFSFVLEKVIITDKVEK